MQVLNTNNGSYIFDDQNPELILKQHGKFSSVYIGYQLPEKNKVIVKILNPALNDDPAAIIRFHKEALKSFEHPDLQKTIDAFNDESGYFLIKEYIDGLTLAQLYKREKITDLVFYIQCTIKLLKILEVLHDKEIIHCDIRPQNILVLNEKEMDQINFDNPQVVLIDLGLAHTPETAGYKSTQPFSLIYSPPEQLLNKPDLINHSSDTYAVAICLYECITGTLPFIHENPEMIQHLQLNTPLLHHKNIPEPLFKILQKATAKKIFPKPPSQYSEEEIKAMIREGQNMRFESATAFKHALMDCLDELEKINAAPKSKPWWQKLFGK